MTKRAEKRLKQKAKALANQSIDQSSDSANSAQHKEAQPKTQSPTHRSEHIKNPFLRFYNDNYKKLLIIPVLLFVLAIAQISIQMSANDGDFINKDISLKGGITITIPTEIEVNTQDAMETLALKGFIANVRNVESGGRHIAVLVESDIDMNDNEKVEGFLAALKEVVEFGDDDYSLEGIGASIGESFFKQTIRALFAAFILMGFVVFLYFGSSTLIKIIGGILSVVVIVSMFSPLSYIMWLGVLIGIIIIILYSFYSIPSIAVIAAALSDIIVTIAIVNLLGIKVSTAGIAAFLMLIGYSVDTDVLLTTRVLKRKEGSLLQRILSAMKTGVLMNFTTLVILAIGLFVSSSEVISQIMTILFIGLLVDQVNTWIQNVGILRLYIEHQEKRKVREKN